MMFALPLPLHFQIGTNRVVPQARVGLIRLQVEEEEEEEAEEGGIIELIESKGESGDDVCGKYFQIPESFVFMNAIVVAAMIYGVRYEPPLLLQQLATFFV